MLCVNCGKELQERGCKVRCPRCGYFEDCSDPAAPGEWRSVGSDGSPEDCCPLPSSPREKPSLPAEGRSADTKGSDR